MEIQKIKQFQEKETSVSVIMSRWRCRIVELSRMKAATNKGRWQRRWNNSLAEKAAETFVSCSRNNEDSALVSLQNYNLQN